MFRYKKENTDIPYEEELIDLVNDNHKKKQKESKDKGKVIKFPFFGNKKDKEDE